MEAMATNEKLKHHIPPDLLEKGLWKLPPLDLGSSTKKETVGCKASWKKDLFKVSVRKRSRYESAASLD